MKYKNRKLAFPAENPIIIIQNKCLLNILKHHNIMYLSTIRKQKTEKEKALNKKYKKERST